MPKSPFFERIKHDVLKIVAAIPYGKVTTYSSIGDHLLGMWPISLQGFRLLSNFRCPGFE